MAAYREACDEARLAAACAEAPRPAASPADDGRLEEGVADGLRAEQVASCYEAARDAAPGRDGEQARARFRSVARFFLDRSSVEASLEIAERFRETPGAFELLLSRSEDDAERLRLHEAWIRHERRLLPARLARRRSRDQAAREVGASSSTVFLALEQPAALAALRDRFARGVIEPLDRAVRAASVERQRRSRLGGHPADGPRLAALAEHRAIVPGSSIAAALRRIGSMVGWDPDAVRPAAIADSAEATWPELYVTPDRGPVILLGAVHGPAGLARGLGTLGLAARAAFLRERRREATHWTDPAFECSVDLIFRRLLHAPSSREWLDLGENPEAAADLRLEQALAHRLAWAYLVLALATTDDPADPPGEEVTEETLERALGRPATPGEKAAVVDGDPRGAAVLRGTVFALLLEERLLTRFGRDWVRDRGARRMLHECWEAEPDENVESMAAALSLGTIEPTPILDGCRP